MCLVWECPQSISNRSDKHAGRWRHFTHTSNRIHPLRGRLQLYAWSALLYKMYLSTTRDDVVGQKKLSLILGARISTKLSTESFRMIPYILSSNRPRDGSVKYSQLSSDGSSLTWLWLAKGRMCQCCEPTETHKNATRYVNKS